MPQEDNQLATIAKENGLEESKVESLLSKFSESFQLAKQIAQDSKGIEVTSEDQIDEMKQAHTARLKLKNIRVEVEHTRKELKEQSLREGKAIDGMANIIKALIIPIEEQLEKQEKFAELKAKEYKAQRLADRIGKLSPYVNDTNLYNLDGMEDDAFEKLLENSIKAQEDAKKAEEDAEKERKAKEDADRKEQERIRKENEELKKQAEAKEKLQVKLNNRINQVTSLGLMWNEEYQSYVKDDFNIPMVDIKTTENDKWDRIIEEVSAEMEQRIEAAKAEKEKADQEAAERLELERKAREEAEAKIKADEEAKAKALQEKEEAERQALLAPDKEKLDRLAESIDALVMPDVKDREAGKVLDETKDFLNRISKNLRKKAEEL